MVQVRKMDFVYAVLSPFFFIIIPLVNLWKFFLDRVVCYSSSLSYQTSYFQFFFVLWIQSQKCLIRLSTRLICTDILQNYGAFIFLSILMNGDIKVPTNSGARDIIYITQALDTSDHLKNSTLSVFLSMFLIRK